MKGDRDDQKIVEGCGLGQVEDIGRKEKGGRASEDTGNRCGRERDSPRRHNNTE